MERKRTEYCAASQDCASGTSGRQERGRKTTRAEASASGAGRAPCPVPGGAVRRTLLRGGSMPSNSVSTSWAAFASSSRPKALLCLLAASGPFARPGLRERGDFRRHYIRNRACSCPHDIRGNAIVNMVYCRGVNFSIKRATAKGKRSGKTERGERKTPRRKTRKRKPRLNAVYSDALAARIAFSSSGQIQRRPAS